MLWSTRQIISWWCFDHQLKSHLDHKWSPTISIAGVLPPVPALEILLRNLIFLLVPFYRRDQVYKKICLCVITFSFFEYWMIWWFRPCKPFTFWKHITLATSTPLFWPSITKYQPVPPFTDPVTQYHPILIHCHRVTTSAALYWPSTTKYRSVLYHTDPVQPSTNQYCLLLTQYYKALTGIWKNIHWQIFGELDIRGTCHFWTPLPFCTTFNWSVCLPVCNNLFSSFFSSFSFSFFSSFCPVSPWPPLSL